MSAVMTQSPADQELRRDPIATIVSSPDPPRAMGGEMVHRGDEDATSTHRTPGEHPAIRAPGCRRLHPVGRARPPPAAGWPAPHFRGGGGPRASRVGSRLPPYPFSFP